MTEHPLHPDLFGGDTPIVPQRSGSEYLAFRRAYKYRQAEKPGPNCGNCAFGFMRGRYRKCEFQGTSHSLASDVSRNKVCDRHKYPREVP